MGGKFVALTLAECDRITRRGRRLDAEGLYLPVAKGGSKDWILPLPARRTAASARVWGYPAVSLAKARMRRGGARDQRQQGHDPLEVRDRQRAWLRA
ncbi:MAG: integrase arm-type DNA-binding domain-containing protein [Pseudomonadales bacterium]